MSTSDNPQSTSISADSIRWCAGLPQVSERELTSEEVERLGNQVRASGRVYLALTLGYPALFLLMLISLWILEPKGEVPNAFWAVVMIVMLVGIGAVVLIARDSRKRSRGLLGDLRSKKVLVFSGPFHSSDPMNETQRLLVKAGYLRVGEE